MADKIKRKNMLRDKRSSLLKERGRINDKKMMIEDIAISNLNHFLPLTSSSSVNFASKIPAGNAASKTIASKRYCKIDIVSIINLDL